MSSPRSTTTGTVTYSIGHSVARALNAAAKKHGAGEAELTAIDRLEDGAGEQVDVDRLAPLARLAGLPWAEMFPAAERVKPLRDLVGTLRTWCLAGHAHGWDHADADVRAKGLEGAIAGVEAARSAVERIARKANDADVTKLALAELHELDELHDQLFRHLGALSSTKHLRTRRAG